MSTATQTPTQRSSNRIADWLNERLGLQGFAYAVPEHANSLPYILGGISLMGFIILIVTGIYLAQFYHPDPADAHDSVVYIISGAPLGDLVRSIHFWTAQIVTLTVFLHMLRIFFTGAYKRPREVNWYIGLGLLAVTLGLAFTGTVLKFDQEGLEALEHNKEAGILLGSLGGWFSSDFSRSTPLLSRLFDAHSTILPLIFGLLIAGHVFLIKMHGISSKVTPDAVAHATAGEGTSHFNVHLERMIGCGLFVLALALLLSLLFPAALGQPGVSGAEVTKPPWMFVWLTPWEAIWGVRALVIIPVALAVVLALVPILDRGPYIAPSRRRAMMVAGGLLIAAIVISGIVGTLQPVTAHLK
jgi:ubiquinol-cytochrome c reductase cytochrome b subunit